jgi:hypothetical protein
VLLKVADRLRVLGLGQRKVFALEVVNGVTGFVGHGDINDNDLGACPKNCSSGRRGRRGGFLSAKSKWCEEEKGYRKENSHERWVSGNVCLKDRP